MAHGFIDIHSVPRSLSIHVQWAIQKLIEDTVSPFNWQAQPLINNHLRVAFQWEHSSSIGAQLVSQMAAWKDIRFEVTEHSDSGNLRWMHTPDFGTVVTVIDRAGNTLVNEQQILAALEGSAGNFKLLQASLRRALAQPWDDELEPFRHAASGDNVVWLRKIS